jgi:hypothetical protein
MSQKPPLNDVDHPKFRENVKTCLEWLMGRRQNRVAKLYDNNRSSTLAVSATPTQAEVQAIATVVNQLAADLRETRAKVNEKLESDHGPYP